MRKKLQRAEEELERTTGKSKRPITSTDSVDEEKETHEVIDLRNGFNIITIDNTTVKKPDRKIRKAHSAVVTYAESDSDFDDGDEMAEQLGHYNY